METADINWRPEVATESEIVTESDTLWSIKCNKNPGHKGFVPYDGIKETDLPEGYQNGETLERIKILGKLVVRLKVKHENGEYSWGSGFVVRMYGHFYITTNNHVVKTEYEAANCQIEFNYDQLGATVFFSKGKSGLFGTNDVMDNTMFGFSPVPQFVQDMNIPEYGANSMYIEDSTGKTIYRSNILIFPINDSPHCHLPFNPNGLDVSRIIIKVRDGESSQLASFYLTCDSIKLCSTSPEVVNVQFNDQMLTGRILIREGRILVKVEKLLTHNDAKECVIIQPHAASCKCTGIYFADTIPTSQFLSKYDRHGSRKFASNFGPEIFVVPFKPVPKILTDLHREFTKGDMVMVIGHPHGAPKMVSFGHILENKTVKNNDRMVDCNVYSCPTCPGCSGSPVLPLKRTFPHSGTTPHFQGDTIRNINMSSFF